MAVSGVNVRISYWSARTCFVAGLIGIGAAWASESVEGTRLKEQIQALQRESVHEELEEQQLRGTEQHLQAPSTFVGAAKPISEDIRHTTTEQVLNAAAFNEVAQSALPLSPQQIIRLRKLFNQTQAAFSTTPGVPPRPVIASRYINLSPGSTPMVIRLAQGYVSTLAFLDSTGQPWPIESYNIGDPQVFNIQWDKKGNLLMIQATALYNTGNLAVQLRDLSTPVMLTLVSGQQAVDYRLDLRVHGIGPNAKPILGRTLPPNVNPELLTILDGIPPPNSVTLQITGGAAQGWLVKERFYIRTRLTLLSPAWIATLSSPDGMRAYELPKTPLILASNNGQTIQLKVQEL